MRVLAQLGCEAVAGIHRGHLAVRGDHDRQRRVLAHQGDDARPRRQSVERLGERHADHRPERVAGTPSPAGRLKLVYESGDLR